MKELVILAALLCPAEKPNTCPKQKVATTPSSEVGKVFFQAITHWQKLDGKTTYNSNIQEHKR